LNCIAHTRLSSVKPTPRVNVGLRKKLRTASVCSLSRNLEPVRPQRQRPPETGDVSTLLRSLVLGQTRQQSFGSSNSLRVSDRPCTIRLCHSPLLLLYRGLGQRQKHFLAPLSHAEIHSDAHKSHVILRIPPPDDLRSMLGAKGCLTSASGKRSWLN